MLVDRPDPEAFAEGIARLGRVRLDATLIRQRALRFSYERFYHEMRGTIEATASASPGTTW